MPELSFRNFTGGELDPALHARADLTKYQNGLATLLNFQIHPQGGVSNRGGWRFRAPARYDDKTARLIPFEFNKEQAYYLEFGDLYMRVIRNGGHVLETSAAITGATQANPVVLTVANSWSNGDEIFVENVGGMTELNGNRYIVTAVTATSVSLTDRDGNTIDGTAFGAYTSGGTAARVFTLSTPYVAADLPRLKYTQSADIMTLTHPSYEERDLSRTDHDVWTLTKISFTPSLSAPTGVTATAGGGGGGDNNKTYEYVVTVVNDSGEESEASSPANETTNSLDGTHYNAIAWGAVTGAEYYNIYKAESEVSDIYGWIGESKTTDFRDYNLLPDIANTPPQTRDPFAGSGNFPGVVSYYQQRKIFARTDNNIQTLFATVSGNFASMARSRPTKADDSIERTIASRTVNEIRHMIDLDGLLLLTSGGVWRVTEGQDGVLTPASIGFRQQAGSRGSDEIPPLIVGNTALYVQAGGKTVRDLAYAFETDSFGGNDLSIIAKHLFKTTTIRDWTYQEEPNGIAWVVLNDGTIVGLTYLKEHQLWGWHRHTTDGLFESIASIPDGSTNTVYAIIKRTINGVTRRYIEELDQRDATTVEDAFFVDSGLTYSGAAATTISGLDHLEGKTVVALAAGNVVKTDANGDPLTVTDGAITLADAATPVHIGLPYNADLETLDIDPVEAAVRGKPLNVAEVIVSVLDSRGGFIGPDADNLEEFPGREVVDSYDTLALDTEEYRVPLQPDWSSNGHVFIRQSDPLPLTVLFIGPDTDVG